MYGACASVFFLKVCQLLATGHLNHCPWFLSALKLTADIISDKKMLTLSNK